MNWRLVKLTIAIYVSARVLGRSLIDYGRELELEEYRRLERTAVDYATKIVELEEELQSRE